MPDEGTSPEIPLSESYKDGMREYPGGGDDDPEATGDGGSPGAEGGENSDAADTPPGLPADHDSEVGSTDQHSDA